MNNYFNEDTYDVKNKKSIKWTTILFIIFMVFAIGYFIIRAIMPVEAHTVTITAEVPEVVWVEGIRTHVKVIIK